MNSKEIICNSQTFNTDQVEIRSKKIKQRTKINEYASRRHHRHHVEELWRIVWITSSLQHISQSSTPLQLLNINFLWFPPNSPFLVRASNTSLLTENTFFLFFLSIHYSKQFFCHFEFKVLLLWATHVGNIVEIFLHCIICLLQQQEYFFYYCLPIKRPQVRISVLPWDFSLEKNCSTVYKDWASLCFWVFFVMFCLALSLEEATTLCWFQVRGGPQVVAVFLFLHRKFFHTTWSWFVDSCNSKS